MSKINKFPVTVLSAAMLLSACSGHDATVQGGSFSARAHHNGEAGFAVLPGSGSLRSHTGTAKPPVVVPQQPVIEPASIRFAGDLPIADDHYAAAIADEYILPPLIQGPLFAERVRRPAMVPTIYREIISRDTALTR